jgi:hypothetical protein
MTTMKKLAITAATVMIFSSCTATAATCDRRIASSCPIAVPTTAAAQAPLTVSPRSAPTWPQDRRPGPAAVRHKPVAVPVAKQRATQVSKPIAPKQKKEKRIALPAPKPRVNQKQIGARLMSADGHDLPPHRDLPQPEQKSPERPCYKQCYLGCCTTGR